MALTTEDLQSIKGIVVDVVDDKIGDLATLIQKEFNQIGDRFDEVDKKFDAIDKRFDEVDKRFGFIENEINSNHGAMISEFIKIHNKIDKNNKRAMDDEGTTTGDILDLKKRVTRLEKLKIA